VKEKIIYHLDLVRSCKCVNHSISFFIYLCSFRASNISTVGAPKMTCFPRCFIWILSGFVDFVFLSK
jgi:hypothetical protein